MDALDNFNATSAFNTSTPTRESDIRSSKRSRKAATSTTQPSSSTVSKSRTAADEEHEGFNTNEFLSYGPSDVLDPQLADLNSNSGGNKNDDSSSRGKHTRARQTEISDPSRFAGVLEQLTNSYRAGDSTAVSLAIAAAASNEQGISLTEEEAQDAVAAAAAAVTASLASSRNVTVGTTADDAEPEHKKRKRQHAHPNSSSQQQQQQQRQHQQQSATSSPPLQSLPQPISRGDSLSTGGVNGGSFTAEETLALENFMLKYGREHDLDHEGLCRRVWTTERKKDNFWDAVTNALPHRTRASVYKHVRRKYHPYEQRGKWTAEEDEQLRVLEEEYGAQWKIIGKHMGRMPEDCRDRFRNYVKCGASRGQNKWSMEEESKLVDIVNEIRYNHPNVDVNWTVVSEKMGGIRSRIQCRYKWKKLTRNGGSLSMVGINVHE
ncbi:uncharacterized protein V2V93DRAFT_371904 [Kockiozyma suomiensis]|uniref:uncharacterized protein n=1 Tax=Kockiozyma suomiensis TaxID=1337062 RepID=UPI003343FEEA